VQVTAAREALEELAEPGVKRSVLRCESFVPDAQELLVVLLDQVFELVASFTGQT
jgi:hypothetical protein